MIAPLIEFALRVCQEPFFNPKPLSAALEHDRDGWGQACADRLQLPYLF